MTHHKQFNNESQDARRHDQHKEVHPDESRSKKDKLSDKENKHKDKK